MLFMITASWVKTAPNRSVRTFSAGIASGAKPKNGEMMDEYRTVLSRTVRRRWFTRTALTFTPMRPLPPIRMISLRKGASGSLGSRKSWSLRPTGGVGPLYFLSFGSYVVFSADQAAIPDHAIGASRFIIGRFWNHSSLT